MVKGISKRVIMVKTPVNSVFEQAIFILKESSFSGTSVKSTDIIAEAKAIADDYVRTHCNRKKRHIKKNFAVAVSSSVLTLALCSVIYMFFL